MEFYEPEMREIEAYIVEILQGEPMSYEDVCFAAVDEFPTAPLKAFVAAMFNLEFRKTIYPLFGEKEKLFALNK